jgi:hypothetical protein
MGYSFVFIEHSILIDKDEVFSENKNVELVERSFLPAILITKIIFGINIINVVKIQIRNIHIP